MGWGGAPSFGHFSLFSKKELGQLSKMPELRAIFAQTPLGLSLSYVYGLTYFILSEGKVYMRARHIVICLPVLYC